MSVPAHLWLDDESGYPFVGSCMMPTRLGSIELNSVMHNITIPVDPHTGRLTATRIHAPISVQKEFDRTTPVLFRALCQARTLKSATIKMYRINEAGIEVEYLISAWITSKSPASHRLCCQTARPARIWKILSYDLKRLHGNTWTVTSCLRMDGMRG
jgi:type VI secretion system secreted protein Hcp